MKLAFSETVRLEELDDLGVSPVLAWRRPLHTYDPSPFQDFLGKVPETPKQVPEQRDVSPKFLERSDIIVSVIVLFIDILPRRSPRTWN